MQVDGWAVLAWVLIGLACLVFWAAVGYLIHAAVASPGKPKVVCVESKPKPYIGTAIRCTQK